MRSTFKSAFSRWHWTTSLTDEADKTFYVEFEAQRYHADPECAVLKEAMNGKPLVSISPRPLSHMRPCTICVPPVDSGNDQ